MATAENATKAPVEEKAPSKMALARALFNTINSETIAEGDSARKQFIARAQTEAGLTKSGAVTYYNNLRNEAKGGQLYGQYGKKAKTEEATAATPEAQAGDSAADAALTAGETLQQQEHAEELAATE